MKFVKQLDENHFVVELGQEDLNKQLHVVVAHDYVEFFDRKVHCTDLRINGPHGAGYGNVVGCATSIQIPIRVAQDLFQTIAARNYMQPEHLVRDEKPVYLDWGIYSTYTYFDNAGTKMIAVEDPETGKFHHMPIALFKQIANLGEELKEIKEE